MSEKKVICDRQGCGTPLNYINRRNGSKRCTYHTEGAVFGGGEGEYKLRVSSGSPARVQIKYDGG